MRSPAGCCTNARRPVPRATSSWPTAGATSSPHSASRSATRRRARSSSAARCRLSDPLRPQPGAGGHEGPPAGAAGLGYPGELDWLGDVQRRAGSPPARLAELCGSSDHQGVCAEAEPYPYADPDGLLAADDALVVCLDQVQDPHNLGAVCRVAEAAGAAGVVIPERRAAEVTPGRLQGLGGRSRAPARGTGAQPGRLAGRRQGGRGCGCTARPRRGATPSRPDRLVGAGGARAGLRGRGHPAARCGGL